MEFEVVKPEHVLVPEFNLRNEEDAMVFIVHDRDPAWKRIPRPIGRYVYTARIPGNFLSEGVLTVGAVIMTEDQWRRLSSGGYRLSMFSHEPAGN